MKQLFCLALCLLTVCTLRAQTARVKAPLKSEDYITRNGNLDNAWYCIQKRKKINVVFLGGSITHMEGWRNLVCRYLQQTYPAAEFSFRNAGIPSLGSVPHAFRFQRDVLDKGPVDLLFVESAVNDHVNGTPEIQQRRALEGIVRHMLSINPAVNIVLMAFVDPDKMAAYRAGKIPAEVQVHAEIAKKYKLPFINLAKEITDRIDAKEFTWEDDFKDLHPAPFGQRLYFNTIKQLLDKAFTRPAPPHLVSVSLIPPLDTFNYAQADYADIHNAAHLQGFALDEDWQPADSTPARPGFVHVPMLVSDSSGHASLDFPFTGRTVGIGVLSGPDAGFIKYSIDGGPGQEIDLYTEWSNSLYLPWYLILGDGLSKENHNLRLQTGGPHAGNTKNVCRIVYFLVNK
jgi:sialidase-1